MSMFSQFVADGASTHNNPVAWGSSYLIEGVSVVPAGRVEQVVSISCLQLHPGSSCSWWEVYSSRIISVVSVVTPALVLLHSVGSLCGTWEEEGEREEDSSRHEFDVDHLVKPGIEQCSVSVWRRRGGLFHRPRHQEPTSRNPGCRLSKTVGGTRGKTWSTLSVLCGSELRVQTCPLQVCQRTSSGVRRRERHRRRATIPSGMR